MFELSVARKYLTPKKKQLSVSLISMMSVMVISLVVWLVLVFLSVTEGIERSWLDKLTALNAPLRITPTAAYYSSYYYQVDSISSDSGYSHKTIDEKFSAIKTDPYQEEVDSEIPRHWKAPDRDKNGKLKDPVKGAFSTLESLKKEIPGLVFQDYELSGAMMRLQLIRPESQIMTSKGDESQGFITQVSYLSSFSDKSPYIQSLLTAPQASDLNHLFYLTNYAADSSLQDKPINLGQPSQETKLTRLKSLSYNTSITELQTSHGFWQIPFYMLQDGESFSAKAHFENGKVSHLLIPKEKGMHSSVKRVGNHLLYTDGKTQLKLNSNTPLIIDEVVRFQSEMILSSIEAAKRLSEIRFKVKTSVQGKTIEGDLPWDGLEISKASVKNQFEQSPKTPPPWLYRIEQNGKQQYVLPEGEKMHGVLLAKSFQDGGVRIGDRGYLAYASPTASSVQEQRLLIYVAGFYDPGIMAIGNKCIMVSKEVAHLVNSASSSFSLDKTLSNGIQVWIDDYKNVDLLKEKLQRDFKALGIDSYWKITTYKEYDFAKDLIEQFQSDKYLFTLVGAIILLVACCNIISLLVLLVNDKKREIGVLQSMGASTASIASIFGLCGILVGIISCLIGTGAALITLRNIDWVVHFLSMLQGHNAFNALFYGKSLPNTLSHDALLFVLIATPLLSLAAGLVPAIKACRLSPSAILRSE